MARRTRQPPAHDPALSDGRTLVSDQPRAPLAFVTIDIDPAEMDVLLEMMRRANVATLSGAIKLGLWKLAEHLDMKLPGDYFACTRGSKKPPQTGG